MSNNYNSMLQSTTTELQEILNTINELPEANTLELDATLTQEGMAADAKAVGDALATKQPAGNYVTESYVNEQIAAIPTPDVYGQINTHNTAIDAHSNMGWLTSDDEIISEPTPIDADTLNGRNAAYFDDQIAVERARIDNINAILRTGEGIPTTTTVGTVGCLYVDILTGDLYKCVAVNDGVYTWVQYGTDGKDGYTPQKGVDYFTSDDISQVANAAADIIRDDIINSLQEKTVAENGEVRPDSGYSGLSKVIVDIPTTEGVLF